MKTIAQRISLGLLAATIALPVLAADLNTTTTATAPVAGASASVDASKDAAKPADAMKKHVKKHKKVKADAAASTNVTK